MKKRYLMMLIMLLSAGWCQAAKTIKTSGKLGAGTTCSGFGICEVKTTTDSPKGLVLTWTLNTSQTVLTLLIETAEEENVPENIAYNLTQGQFVMSAAYTFPAEVSAALESMGTITIPAGTYTATHSSAGYTINFSIE